MLRPWLGAGVLCAAMVNHPVEPHLSSMGAPGDGGPAVDAALVAPEGVVVDYRGNVFVAERGAHRVRRVDGATGIITTVAGTGETGYGGDEGPAVDALLNTPSDLAVDAAGNLYIADAGNHRIRRVDTATGRITTVAGTGEAGFSGDGELATRASLRSPFGVAVGSDEDLYIADTDNQRVRRIDAVTGRISTVAGNGVWDFGGDGGSALEASLARPHRIAVGPGGDVYIADSFNHRIRVVSSSDGTIRTIAGIGTMGSRGDGGPALEAAMTYFGGMVLKGDRLVFTDLAFHRLRSIDLENGIITTVAGTGQWGFSGDGGPALKARLHLPGAIALAPDGDLVFTDMWNGRVRRIDDGSGSVTTIAGSRPTPPTPAMDFHFHYDPDSVRAAHDAVVVMTDEASATLPARTLALAAGEGAESLRVRVYPAPGVPRAPLVLLVHGRAEDEFPPETWKGLDSWARLLATRGLTAAVVYHRLGSRARSLDPGFEDVRTALDNLRANASDLALDPNRICLMSLSGGSALVAPFLGEPPSYLRCVAMFSPNVALDPPGVWDWFSEERETRHRYTPMLRLTADAPELFVAVGAEDRAGVTGPVDEFVRRARTLDVGVTFERHPTGGEGFERLDHDVASRDIVGRALGFLRASLAGSP
jgi:acetyl esterase/lipase/sugar lactone lactonase YvrE